MDPLEENDFVYDKNGRRAYTREHWKEIEKEEAASKETFEKSSLEEDQIAYDELKAEGFDFFKLTSNLGSFVLEDELKAIQEKAQSMMEKDDFYEINGFGNGKQGAFMRVKG
jgi:DNA-binding transcriptional regulator YhcF (GntR family)